MAELWQDRASQFTYRWEGARIGGNAIGGVTVENISRLARYDYSQLNDEAVAVVSDSADDTFAGSGARAVQIIGIRINNNGDWEYAQEVVALNGLTPVLTTETRWVRVFEVIVGLAGTKAGNQGVITVTNIAGTYVHLAISLEANKSHSGRFTVAKNYFGKILNFVFTTFGGNYISFNFGIRAGGTNNGQPLIEQFQANVQGGSSLSVFNDGTPSPFSLSPDIDLEFSVAHNLTAGCTSAAALQLYKISNY